MVISEKLLSQTRTTGISQKRGDYIRKSTSFDVFCLFCLLLNFLPLTRISALFAPFALFGCPTYYATLQPLGVIENQGQN